MEIAERKKQLEQRRKLRSDTLKRIKNLSFENKIPEKYRIELEKFINEKLEEVGKELSKFSEREEIAEQWENIKKRIRFENILTNSLVDYSTQEKLSTLSDSHAVSLGVNYVGNCAIIVSIDNLMAIGKIEGNSKPSKENKKAIPILADELMGRYLHEDDLSSFICVFSEPISFKLKNKRIVWMGSEGALVYLVKESISPHKLLAINLDQRYLFIMKYFSPNLKARNRTKRKFTKESLEKAAVSEGEKTSLSKTLKKACSNNSDSGAL
ncbi:hypothetical protein BH11BAC7_BH11BAC7_26320 [soil metagenome]